MTRAEIAQSIRELGQMMEVIAGIERPSRAIDLELIGLCNRVEARLTELRADLAPRKAAA